MGKQKGTPAGKRMKLGKHEMDISEPMPMPGMMPAPKPKLPGMTPMPMPKK